MILSTVTGVISRDAEYKETPDKQKQYAFFIVKSYDERNTLSLIKCYYYGCSKKTLKLLRESRKIVVLGTQNVNLFKKGNDTYDINININVLKLELQDYERTGEEE